MLKPCRHVLRPTMPHTILSSSFGSRLALPSLAGSPAHEVCEVFADSRLADAQQTSEASRDPSRWYVTSGLGF